MLDYDFDLKHIVLGLSLGYFYLSICVYIGYIDDFMILKDSGIIKNKTNDDFQYKIFENSIPVVEGLLVMDTIKVYKENEQRLLNIECYL